MQSIRARAPYVCNDCLSKLTAGPASKCKLNSRLARRRLLQTSAVRSSPPPPSVAGEAQDERHTAQDDAQKGAMSRRLEQLTDEGLENSGARADTMVEQAGFSEQLKKRLEGRILDANFRNENARAFAEVSIPRSAGKGTRDIASAAPWTGEEALGDAALRMLDDAHKPLRMPARSTRTTSNPVDLRPRRQTIDRGTRLANARDKTSIYALSQDGSMTEAERAAMKSQLKERFTPSARSVPATVSGIQSIASQRIEDAIARGMFKNIPRGKGVNIGRDHNADSPFIDTTEYFMNKIIKKQDLTPPWIEKQAEIHSTAARFRGRIRVDWKRHAARVIASRGGSLDEQISRAKAYATAEAIDNPPPESKKETLTGLDSQGGLTHVTVEAKLTPGDSTADEKITVTEETASLETVQTLEPSVEPQPTTPKDIKFAPFRDPAWNALEQAYHLGAIKQLNSLTRSYNLMAPELAKKPYFTLDRELRACYAEVAPQLADEIRNRALTPKVRVEVIGHRPGGVLEKFAGGEAARVVADRRKPYGFKEFWRDLFSAS